MKMETAPRRVAVVGIKLSVVLCSRWSVPMMMSITHRGTGVGLSGGNPISIYTAAICSFSSMLKKGFFSSIHLFCQDGAR